MGGRSKRSAAGFARCVRPVAGLVTYLSCLLGEGVNRLPHAMPVLLERHALEIST